MIKESPQNNTFHEIQRYRAVWIWLILILVNILAFAGWIYQSLTGDVIGNHPMSNDQLFYTAIAFLIFTFLFRSFRLETHINQNGITFKWFPLSGKKNITWEEISEIAVGKYNPIKEYGGWGVRFGIVGKGMAYNISGNQGIKIRKASGQQILIGTKKPKEAQLIIDQFKGLIKKGAPDGTPSQNNQ